MVNWQEYWNTNWFSAIDESRNCLEKQEAVCQVDCRGGEIFLLQQLWKVLYKKCPLQKAVQFVTGNRKQRHIEHVMSLLCTSFIQARLHVPRPHPFAFAGGEACCQFFTTKPGVAGCANPDGGSLDFDDPVECCPRGASIDCPDTQEGCKNYPYAGGKGVSFKNTQWDIL